MLGRKTPELYMEIMNMLQMINPKHGHYYWADLLPKHFNRPKKHMHCRRNFFTFCMDLGAESVEIQSKSTAGIYPDTSEAATQISLILCKYQSGVNCLDMI